MTSGFFLPSLQALFKMWGSPDKYPKDILTYTELVLDSQGQLVEMNRLPGGNEVRSQRARSLSGMALPENAPPRPQTPFSLCICVVTRWAWWPSK